MNILKKLNYTEQTGYTLDKLNITNDLITLEFTEYTDFTE